MPLLWAARPGCAHSHRQFNVGSSRRQAGEGGSGHLGEPPPAVPPAGPRTSHSCAGFVHSPLSNLAREAVAVRPTASKLATWGPMNGTAILTVPRLIKLAEAFGVDPAELLRDVSSWEASEGAPSLRGLTDEERRLAPHPRQGAAAQCLGPRGADAQVAVGLAPAGLPTSQQGIRDITLQVRLPLKCRHVHLSSRVVYLRYRTVHLNSQVVYLRCRAMHLSSQVVYLRCRAVHLCPQVVYLRCRAVHLSSQLAYLRCRAVHLNSQLAYLRCRAVHLNS